MPTAKSSWPPGPWHDEPDEHEWVYCTYPCRIARGPGGAWCGYITLPAHHPWRSIIKNIGYDGIDCTVHGGLTYANGCTVGFDCAHGWDLCPALGGVWNAGVWDANSTYRDMAYVIAQCESLARQAIKAEHALENSTGQGLSTP